MYVCSEIYNPCTHKCDTHFQCIIENVFEIGLFLFLKFLSFHTCIITCPKIDCLSKCQVEGLKINLSSAVGVIYRLYQLFSM